MILEIHQFILCMFLGFSSGLGLFIYSEIYDGAYRTTGSLTGGSRVIKIIYCILALLIVYGIIHIW